MFNNVLKKNIIKQIKKSNIMGEYMFLLRTVQSCLFY